MDDKMTTLKSFIDKCFEINDYSDIKNIHELNLLRNIPFSYMSGYVGACLDLDYISIEEHAELMKYIKEAREKMA